MPEFWSSFTSWIESHLTLWVAIGFIGQFMFMMRFVMQWVASERAKRSVVPEIFWFFSLVGGVILLAYALYRQDPVFIVGQSMGLFIYARNIFFILREKKQDKAAAI